MNSLTKEIKKINSLKKMILDTAYCSQEGHIPSAFSILDIIWVLHKFLMHKNDVFILSKGQGCLALYATLADLGDIDKEKLKNHYCEYNSPIGGHPDRNKIKSIVASTGSLGHGLPIAVGMSMAKQISKSQGRIICLIGDGEANEGSVWEAALLASHHKLNNLICIVDNNHSTDRALNMGDFDNKFRAFGWDVAQINGHDHDEIKAVFRKKMGDRPTCIVSHTIKGYGCKSMENNPAWHHKAPTKEEYQLLISELDES